MANSLFAALDLVAKRDEDETAIRHNYRFIEQLLLDDDAEQATLRLSSVTGASGVRALGNHVVAVKQLVSQEVRKSLQLGAQFQNALRSCSCAEDELEAEAPPCVSMKDISVEYSGRFSCLHVRVTGLHPERKYFLALDLLVVGGKSRLKDLACTAPYCVPCPNHRQGRQWMESELSFNLNAVITDHLRNRCGGIKAHQEYEPTLRVLELRDDLWPSVEHPVDFRLKQAAFLAFLLKGALADASYPLATQKYVLVKKSTLLDFRRDNCKPIVLGTPAPGSRPSLSDCSIVTAPLKPTQERTLFSKAIRRNEDVRRCGMGRPITPNNAAARTLAFQPPSECPYRPHKPDTRFPAELTRMENLTASIVRLRISPNRIYK